MLPFFPSPYPDELFYSVCARYHLWSRNKNVRWTKKDLFDKESVSIPIELPTNLNMLYKKLTSGSLNKPDVLIENTSLFPFYKPFLPLDRVKMIINGMKESGYKNGDIRMSTGITTNHIESIKHLRYCPDCIREDNKKYHEFYWHRSHQISVINVCPIHNAVLVNSGIPVRNKGLIDLEDVINEVDKCETRYESNSHCLEIAKEVYWLLSKPIPVLGLQELRRRYLYYLQKCNLATYTGKVRQRVLVSELSDFYNGDNFFQKLNNKISIKQVGSMIKNILLEQPRSVHPIYHVLLIKFLGLSLEEFFFNEVGEFKPFGEAPWICLNHVANHYKKPVINRCEVTLQPNTGLPLGTFYCDCGFIYTRKGPDKDESDKYKITSIRAYGKIWSETLIHLHKVEKKSNKEIAKCLNIDPKTVKNQLIRLLHANDQPFEHKLKSYRQAWLNIIENNPEKRRKELSQMMDKEYNWLYRNDYSWLLSNSPPDKAQPPPKHLIGGKLVDWEKRDQEVAKQIKQISNEMRNLEGKPIRITVSSIGKKLGNLWLLQKQLSKLPLTKNAIDSAVETTEDFQLRRVRWVIQKFNEDGVRFTKWQVEREAGLSRSYSERVGKEIDNALIS
jgi:hypothetical protein